MNRLYPQITQILKPNLHDLWMGFFELPAGFDYSDAVVFPLHENA